MIAVTGACGQLGRLVLRDLLRHVGPARAIALSRTPSAVPPTLAASRFADFDDPAGLVRAFDGVERLLLISTNVFDPAGRRIRQHINAIRAATRAGVGHVLYTSITRAGDPDHPAAVAADHRATETALAESGLPYTVLRHNMYTQNILMGLSTMLATGHLLDNTGDGATSYVTRDDCAAVAATILANGGHERRTLEITGPAALTQAEVAALITELTGIAVRYVPISDEHTVNDLVRHGMFEPTARRFATIGTAVRAGFTELVSDTVKKVTQGHATPTDSYLAAALTPLGYVRRRSHRVRTIALRHEPTFAKQR